MNSWGVAHPNVSMLVHSPAICRIFKVDLVYIRPLMDDDVDHGYVYHGLEGDCAIENW